MGNSLGAPLRAEAKTRIGGTEAGLGDRNGTDDRKRRGGYNNDEMRPITPMRGRKRFKAKQRSRGGRRCQPDPIRASTRNEETGSLAEREVHLLGFSEIASFNIKRYF